MINSSSQNESWITLRTLTWRWEAELMQQILTAQQIPCRMIDLGIVSYLGMSSPTALQVPTQYLWAARLLLSPVEESD
jgi:hypothetical protein